MKICRNLQGLVTCRFKQCNSFVFLIYQYRKKVGDPLWRIQDFPGEARGCANLLLGKLRENESTSLAPPWIRQWIRSIHTVEATWRFWWTDLRFAALLRPWRKRDDLCPKNNPTYPRYVHRTRGGRVANQTAWLPERLLRSSSLNISLRPAVEDPEIPLPKEW